MSKNTLARIEKLERGGADRTGRRILAAADHDEAVMLRERHPAAAVVITGVRRSPEGIAR